MINQPGWIYFSKKKQKTKVLL